MPVTPIYLDYNATAPMYPEVRAVMQALLADPLNPSSVHSFGRKARKLIEDARLELAKAVSCFPQEIIFVGSGTEANNLALHGVAETDIWISAIEHASVAKAVPHARRIPVTAQGVLDVEALAVMLAQYPAPKLVSVMLANNETGVIQPVREVVELCRPLGIRVHCDVVQGLGKIPVDMGVLGVDMMTLAAHKMGGPVGAAALVVRQGYATKTHILGGGQELNRRAGTENVAALAGWAKALELSAQGNWQPQVREWFEALEVQLMAAGAEVLGHAAPRLPNTLSVRMPHMKAETQLMHFDLCGLAVSAGSACSSGRIEPSAVIQAMGVPAKEAAEVIRVSAGWATQPSDLEAFAQAWLKLAKRAKIT